MKKTLPQELVYGSHWQMGNVLDQRSLPRQKLTPFNLKIQQFGNTLCVFGFYYLDTHLEC